MVVQHIFKLRLTGISLDSYPKVVKTEFIQNCQKKLFRISGTLHYQLSHFLLLYNWLYLGICFDSPD